MPNNPKLHFPLSVLLHDGNFVLTVRRKRRGGRKPSALAIILR